MNLLFLLNTEEWALLLLGICIIPIAFLIIFAIVKVVLKKKKKDSNLLQDPTVMDEQKERFLNAFGGKENITSIDIERQKLKVTLVDIEKVNGDELKELGASGVLLLGNEVRASFGDRCESIYNLLK